MHKLVTFLTVAAVAAPFAAGAATSAELQAQAQALLQQVAALQAQMGTQTTGAPIVTGTGQVTSAVNVTTNSPICPQIGRILYIGAQGDDVTRLQQFLARDPSVYPEGKVTGYYGTLTETAVKRWQVKYNIVSTGTQSSTGYGQVGPRTAAAMSLQCSQGGGVVSSGGTGGLYSGTVPGVAGGFIQVAPIQGNAPLSVKVTATVNTASSCGGGSYSLGWGDGTIPSVITVPVGQCAPVVQNYGHTYIYGGTYIVTLASGAHSTSATVVVSGAGAPVIVPVTNTNTTNTSSNTSTTTTTQTSTYTPFSLTPNAGGNPLAVTVQFDLTGCPAFSLSWGDGTGFSGGGSTACASASPSYSHVYAQAGSYQVSVVRGAQTDTASITISN